MDRNEIVFIGQSHAWYYKYIQQLGYKSTDSYINHGTLFRILREVFFRLKLPGKSLFYNRDVLVETHKVFIVNESLITYEYIKWLHKKCPSCLILLNYTNPVNPKYSPDGFLDDWCIKWTSDMNDAKKYRMCLNKGGGYFPQWKVKKTAPVYDVFYIGKDKNRLGKLRQIESNLQAQGVKTMFYITWPRSWQKKDDGIHRPFLPYEDVLGYIGRSKSILHLLDGAQNGITLRIQESLIHKVKLITDDVNIANYDFYNPKNIFILGQDDMNKLRMFLDAPYEEVQSEFYNHAFYDQMIEEMVTESINSREFSDI